MLQGSGLQRAELHGKESSHGTTHAGREKEKEEDTITIFKFLNFLKINVNTDQLLEVNSDWIC